MRAWTNGVITDAADARISILDHGLLYGDGVFEGVRIACRRLFRLPDHLARLRVSARAIGLGIPWDDAFLTGVLTDTARAHGEDEAYARLIVTRGVGALGVDPSSCPEPGLIVIVGDIELFSPEKSARGIALATSSLRRPPFDVLDPRVKSLNYLNNVLAKAEAKRHGADEALVLNTFGRIAETSVANLFMVGDGRILTPSPSEGALAGITRGSVLEAAGAAGITVSELALTRADLFTASEVFLTGSGAGIVPVGSLDGQPVGTDPARPVTTRIAAALDAMRGANGVEF